MTARSKSRRDKNNRIRRAKNKQKEIKKLKKTLGLLDEDGKDLIEKVKDITEQEKKKQEEKKIKLEVMEDIIQQETSKVAPVKKKFIVVENEQTKVKHRYNVKTKQDQFGQYPVWYKYKKERKKQLLREGKIKKKRGRPGKRMHFIDETCMWRNMV
ncbi:protein LLP homolog [Toxorhynchites rutilus septentrionalis]|uniref:protein LLP homolog n=1 Tax=Toxorhynchites rutilus septentrionalis TaxID=329112 RepID=UPI0024792744|nr:protein LLP homolog [Toxorhynchites rutilus septentrionalis]